jgi:hypothetical protein
MTTVKVRWSVDELDNVRSLFTVQRVYRSTTLPTGPWAEITSVATRVPLVAGVTSYLYDDTAGSAAYWYCVDYYHAGTGAYSDKSDPMRAAAAVYATIGDLRDEGLPTTITDARAMIGLERATATIDRATGQWFEPRTRTYILDANTGRDLLLNVPIIAPTSVFISTHEITPADLCVYNRHLTEGLTNPDDRRNPRLAWREFDYPSGIGSLERGARRWFPGRQRVTVTGVFGYTELGPTEAPAETVAGSQIPVSYGGTPDLIRYACLRLALRFAYPLAGGQGDDIRLQRRLTGETTRDQSYSLSSPSASSAAWGATGDEEVDAILEGFMAPIPSGVV